MIKLDVDVTALIELRTQMQSDVERLMVDAAKDLATQTYAHIVEDVQKELHSTREKYLAALSIDQVAPDTWIVGLDKSGMWIEDGLEEHETLDDLLSSPKAKRAADGSTYIVVPFQHNKGPTKQTPAQNDLTNTIKAELKRRQIPYGKLETKPDGTPKMGLLHKIDILRSPLKTKEGPGMGHGAIGQVRQGRTGTPFLQGIRVYQKALQDAATGKMSVVKQIMTFRVASSKHKGTGRWVHPGLKAKNFFEKAEKWAMEQFETKIVPDILARLGSR